MKYNVAELAESAMSLAVELWPLNRSLINKATSITLSKLIGQFEPAATIHRFPSGMQLGTWTIPKAWEVKSAKVKNLQGEVLINWEDCNLHLMSYSRSVSGKYSHEELMRHIHFDKKKPRWIPYRTSYYDDDWAFCVSESEFTKLNQDFYQIDIDTEFQDSNLEIGEVYIPGKTRSEIVFTTYVCHPSMANNELSGPIVLQALIKYLMQEEDNYYSYRFLFLPETIGAIAYLSENFAMLKENVVAGFVVTCIGDNRDWGYIPSRSGATMADKVAKRVLEEYCDSFKSFSFLDRGSDERQFCSPGVDLPFCSITRSKYATYPEYHTSGDDLSMFSIESLSESIGFFIELIYSFEKNRIYVANQIGEPFFKNFGMRKNQGASLLDASSKVYSDVVALSDKTNDAEELVKILNCSREMIETVYSELTTHCLVEKI